VAVVVVVEAPVEVPVAVVVLSISTPPLVKPTLTKSFTRVGEVTMARLSCKPRLLLLSTLLLSNLVPTGAHLPLTLQAGEPMHPLMHLPGMFPLVKLPHPPRASPLNVKVVLAGRRKRKTIHSLLTSTSLRRRRRKPLLCPKSLRDVRPTKAQMAIFGKAPSLSRKATMRTLTLWARVNLLQRRVPRRKKKSTWRSTVVSSDLPVVVAVAVEMVEVVVKVEVVHVEVAVDLVVVDVRTVEIIRPLSMSTTKRHSLPSLDRIVYRRLSRAFSLLIPKVIKS
jgi:hypothetical protein